MTGKHSVLEPEPDQTDDIDVMPDPDNLPIDPAMLTGPITLPRL